ncbi:HAMP domain-containing sensor histidine kinase [Paraglaciecola sp.]|uniref:sensor histidine kinase n=1 Tax=Paraglaciecola sp. TaxID=1920173 RepID=UPI0030F4A1ED
MQRVKPQIRKLRNSLAFNICALLSVALLLSWLVFQQIVQTKMAILNTAQSEKLLTAIALFNSELGSLRDILALLNSNSLLTENATLAYEEQRQQVQRYFADFGQAANHISQIRWINLSGQEMIRVDFSAHSTTIFAPSLLQNKSSRYYVTQGLKVEAPKVYLSPIDLNKEHGEVQRPFQITIRATLKTNQEQHLIQGVLVINYNLNSLFSDVRALSDEQVQLQIVNIDGFWLLHTSPEQEWGFMLEQPDHNISTANPGAWSLLHKDMVKMGKVINGELLSFNTIQLSKQYNVEGVTPKTSEIKAHNNKLFVLAISPPNILSNIHQQALLTSLVCGLVMASIGILVILRKYKFQQKLLALSEDIIKEKTDLDNLNTKLTSSLEQQQILQDSLVEAEKLSSLGMMVAGVAHELNTPLGGALMSVSSAQGTIQNLKNSIEQGLSKRTLDDSLMHIEEGLELANNNMTRAAGLVKSFKRMAIDRVSEESLEFHLQHLVQDIFLTLKPKFKTTKLTITHKIDPNILLNSRPGILSQVLENLIINAINHGFIENQSGQITLSAEQQDEQIVIKVTDTGCGISVDMREHIFEPFVTSARSKGNTGLGLYFVHQWITKILNGQLELHSEEGKGTEFVIYLPISFSSNDDKKEPECAKT